MGASQKKPWLRFVKKRSNMTGEGGGERSLDRSGSFAALFSRLRRAEVVILHLTMKLTVRDTLLDKLLSDMLDLSSVDEPSGSGSPDGGDEVPVPLQGSPDGEDKGTSDAQE